jgi:hypothetical protein
MTAGAPPHLTFRDGMTSPPALFLRAGGLGDRTDSQNRMMELIPLNGLIFRKGAGAGQASGGAGLTGVSSASGAAAMGL